jgi:hypothetical protein
VEDAFIPCSDDALALHDAELRLEEGGRVDGALPRAVDEPIADVGVFDAAKSNLQGEWRQTGGGGGGEANSDLVAWLRKLDWVLVAVDGDELDRAADRLDEELLAVVGEADGADLEFAEDDRDAHCLVRVHDGQRRGAVEEARWGTKLVEDREQREASERGTEELKRRDEQAGRASDDRLVPW